MTDPFKPSDLTMRERWALLKSRIAIWLCDADIRPCRTCRIVERKWGTAEFEWEITIGEANGREHG